MTRMSGKQRAERGTRIAEELKRQLVRAIALSELWVRCFDQTDVCSFIDARQELVPAFTHIRESLHFELVLTLTRLHDNDKNVASIPNAIAIVSDPNVEQFLADLKARDAALRDNKILQAQAILIRRIFKMRDKGLAHSDAGNVTFDNTYGDEITFLKHSFDIGTSLYVALTGKHDLVDYPWAKGWKTFSNDFWLQFIGQRPR